MNTLKRTRSVALILLMGVVLAIYFSSAASSARDAESDDGSSEASRERLAAHEDDEHDEHHEVSEHSEFVDADLLQMPQDPCWEIILSVESIGEEAGSTTDEVEQDILASGMRSAIMPDAFLEGFDAAGFYCFSADDEGRGTMRVQGIMIGLRAEERSGRLAGEPDGFWVLYSDESDRASAEQLAAQHLAGHTERARFDSGTLVWASGDDGAAETLGRIARREARAGDASTGLKSVVEAHVEGRPRDER